MTHDLPARVRLRGIVGGLLVAAMLGIGAPSLAAQPWPGQPRPAPSPQPAVTAAQGIVTVSVRATSRMTLAKMVQAKPCLRLRSGAGVATTACVTSDHQVRAYQSDRPRFRAPAQLRADSRRTFTLRVRQADLMLPAGRATATVSCHSHCEPSTETIVVPKLRMATCTARGPWLRHSGDPSVGKAVALTFDDGPGADTRRVMRILKAERVPGTFFMVGQMIDRYPSFPRRILNAGNALGNHTWSHPTMSGADVRQITRTQHRIRRGTGFVPCVFRAPYGANPRPVVQLARSLNLTTVNWNVDPRDWTGADPNTITRTTLRQVQPGSIAVFHDGSERRQFLTALPRIITDLKQRGYRFLTVPELLQLPITYRS